jgi:hypothetical protein
MDDAFSNSSFSIASRKMFNLRETNELEFQMFRLLDLTLGVTGWSQAVEELMKEFREFCEGLDGVILTTVMEKTSPVSTLAEVSSKMRKRSRELQVKRLELEDGDRRDREREFDRLGWVNVSRIKK